MGLTNERTEFGIAAIHGTAWRYISYFSGKFMVFLSTIVLARLLAKDDDVVKFSGFLTVAVLVHPNAVGGHAERCNRRSRRKRLELGITGEIAEDEHFVEVHKLCSR